MPWGGRLGVNKVVVPLSVRGRPWPRELEEPAASVGEMSPKGEDSEAHNNFILRGVENRFDIARCRKQ